MDFTSDHFQSQAIRVYDDVEAGHHKNLKVDVYAPPKSMTPSTDKGFPVFFYIHGGAWHLGNKKSAIQPGIALAKEGYVTVSSSYRLSRISDHHMQIILAVVSSVLLLLAFTTVTTRETLFVLMLLVCFMAAFTVLWMLDDTEMVHHPDHIMDVAHHFKWTCENIHRYGGDPDNIVVMGHSAGGHLASLLSTNHRFLKLIEGDPSKIKGCIGISGVYSDKRMQNTQMGQALLYSTFGKRPNYLDAFPIYNIDDSTPPFLFFNTKSDLSLQFHTTDLHFALRQKQIYSKVIYSEDRNHFNICSDWGQGQSNRSVFEHIHNFRQELNEFIHS